MTTAPGNGAVGLSPEAAQRISWAATSVVVLIAGVSALLSWESLTHLAATAGISSPWALPLIVDGTVLAGMLGVLAGTLAGSGVRYAWALVLLGTATSVVGNFAAAPTNATARAVAVIAPVFLALSLEQGLRLLRHRAGLPAPRARRQRTAVPSPSSAPSDTSAQVSTRIAQSSGTSVTGPRPGSRPRPGGRRDQVAALLTSDPSITGAQVAASVGIDPSDARRHLRALRAEQHLRATLNLATTTGGA